MAHERALTITEMVQRPNHQGRFFCHSCLARHDAPGDCPRAECDEEPLLDLEDEEVRDFLEQADGKARTRRFALCFGLALLIGIPIILVTWFGFGLGMLPSILGGAFATFGLATLFAKLFPAKRRDPKLSDQEIEQLESLARS